MELKIKFNEEILVEMANRVLDEYEYKGKTIREWADLIAHPKTKADLIRTMSDEELNEFIDGIMFKSDERNRDIRGTLIRGEFLTWLKQEAEKTDE